METERLSNLAKNIIPPPCFPFAVRSPESFRRFEHQRSVSKKEKKKKGRGKKASTMSLYRRSLFSPSTQVFSILATRLREKFDSSRNFTDVNLLHLTFEDGEALRWMKRRWTSIEKDGKSFDPRGITIRTVITKSRIRIGGKVSCRRDATSGAFLRPLATADNSAKDTAERVERTRSIHDSDVF